MKILGLDPSLTNFGWALHDTEATEKARCIQRGRFQTSNKLLYISRYTQMRDSVRQLIQQTEPDAMGIEFPVFGNLYSEGMYGLFLFVSEAIFLEKKDVVFWSPLQVKAHAREFLARPKGWKMEKPDMVETAKLDTGGKGSWNHNEADAYLVAKLSGVFWKYQAGLLTEKDLSESERKFLLDVKTHLRGKKEGQTELKGITFREDERFFMWSREETDKGDINGNED